MFLPYVGVLCKLWLFRRSYCKSYLWELNETMYKEVSRVKQMLWKCCILWTGQANAEWQQWEHLKIKCHLHAAPSPQPIEAGGDGNLRRSVLSKSGWAPCLGNGGVTQVAQKLPVSIQWPRGLIAALTRTQFIPTCRVNGHIQFSHAQLSSLPPSGWAFQTGAG